jgi:hypothetical protein
MNTLLLFCLSRTFVYCRHVAQDNEACLLRLVLRFILSLYVVMSLVCSIKTLLIHCIWCFACLFEYMVGADAMLKTKSHCNKRTEKKRISKKKRLEGRGTKRATPAPCTLAALQSLPPWIR